MTATLLHVIAGVVFHGPMYGTVRGSHKIGAEHRAQNRTESDAADAGTPTCLAEGLSLGKDSAAITIGS